MGIRASEADKDHRELGQELNYFSFHEEGPGFPFFHHKGNLLKSVLIDLWRKEHFKAGYVELSSPMMLDESLWRKSGHMDHFQENMFFSNVEKHNFAIKPMSCPGAMLAYNEKKRSFKELPLRICELGHVHRNENSGSLHGLLRVRSFVQDDAHIFCSHEDVKSEIKNVLHLFQKILNRCGFNEFKIELSLRGGEKQYLGEDEDWLLAERYLADVVSECGLRCEKKEGEAKFYGPSLDLHIKDRNGKYWQCSTLQFDFNLPQKFNLSYFDADGIRKVPLVLHRAIFGSLERFIGILLEFYQGEFPLWMAPVQARVIMINRVASDYSQKLFEDLWDAGIRVEIDLREDHINEKILRAQKEKVPLMILIGKNEMENGRLSIRDLSGNKSILSVDELIRKVKHER
jgi:threonyl-tRNA synthetase